MNKRKLERKDFDLHFHVSVLIPEGSQGRKLEAGRDREAVRDNWFVQLAFV